MQSMYKSIKFHSIELDGKLKLKTLEDKVFGFYLEAQNPCILKLF